MSLKSLYYSWRLKRTVTNPEILLNSMLFTRDGRRAGNAVVTRIESADRIYAVSDYGNKFGPMTRKEVYELFRIGPVNSTHKGVISVDQ